MRPALRKLLVALGVLLLLLLLVRFIPVGGLVDRALREAEARTGLAIAFDDARLNLLPLGLKLDGVELHGQPLAAPQVDSLDIRADGLVARASLLSLLKRQPQVHEVALLSPVASIWLGDAPADTQGAKGDGGEGGAPAAAALELLSIEDGSLELHQPDGRVVALRGFHQRASASIEAGRATGEAELGWAELVLPGVGELPPTTLPPLDASLEFDLPSTGEGEGRLQLASLESGGLRADGEATVQLRRGAAPVLDARFQLGGELAGLQEGWRPALRSSENGAERLPATLEDGRVAGELRVQGELPSPDPGEDPLPAWLALLSGQGEIAGGRARLHQPDLPLGFAGSWALRDGRVELSALDLRLPGAKATGTMTLPATGEGRLDGTLEATADLRVLRGEMARAWPSLPAELREGKTPPGEWPGVAGMLRGSVRLAVPLPPPEDPSQWPDDAIRYDLAPRSLAVLLPGWRDSVRVGEGKLRGGLSRIPELRAALDGPGFRGQFAGEADGWPDAPRVGGQLELSELDLDLVAAASSAEGASLGPASGWVAPARANEAPAPPPENLTADIALGAEVVKSKGYRITGAKGQLRLREQQLTVDGLEGALGSGRLEGTARCDWTVPRPQWSLDARAVAVPAGALVEPFAPVLAKALSSELNSDVTLSAPLGATPQELMSSLQGSLAVLGKSGVLQTEPIVGGRIASFLGERVKPGWQQLRFGSLQAACRVDQGRVGFEDLRIDGDYEVAANGWVGLDGRCDYRVRVRLPPGVVPAGLGQLSGFVDQLRDADGRLAFTAHLHGPATKPAVDIDLSQLEERLKGAAQDRIRDELRGFLGRNGLAPATPDSQAGVPAPGELREKGQATVDSVAKELEEKAKEGLRDLLRRRKGGSP